MDKLKKIVVTATIGFCLVTLLNSCHKYPDDPFISLRKPLARLNYRHWYLNKYLVNGVDSISRFSNGTYVYFEDNHGGNFWRSFPTCDQGGGWGVGPGNALGIGRGLGYTPPACNGQILFPTEDWTIRELYGKKLIIVGNANNKTYELHFNSK